MQLYFYFKKVPKGKLVIHCDRPNLATNYSLFTFISVKHDTDQKVNVYNAVAIGESMG